MFAFVGLLRIKPERHDHASEPDSQKHNQHQRHSTRTHDNHHTNTAPTAINVRIATVENGSCP